jgi:hypothetical protein
MIRYCDALKALVLLLASGTVATQTSPVELKVPKPGIGGVQAPYSSIKPSATSKVGGTADWVLIGDDARSSMHSVRSGAAGNGCARLDQVGRG